MKETLKENKDNNSKSLYDLLKGRENYFDLIRLLAALLVIFSHAFPLSGTARTEPLYQISNGQVTLGNLAVIIFFIISGLLITQSYLYSNNLITFLKYRILRIFPGLIGVLLFSAFVIGPMVSSLSFSDYIANHGVLQYLKAVFLFPMQWNLPGVFEHNAYKNAVNGSLWTIPFEFLCYLVVGIFGFLGILRHRFLMLLLTIAVFYYYLFSSSISPAGAGHIFGLDVNTFIELLLFFLVGCLACLFKEKIYLKKEIAMIGIAVLFISMFYGGFKPLFAVFGTYIILYAAFLPRTKAAWITKYGDFSYGIYLYAFPIQQSVTYWLGGKTSLLTNFLISTPLTVLCAIASWFIIEKNFLKLKKFKIIGESFKIERFPGFVGKIKFRIENIVNYLLEVNWLKYFLYLVVFIILFLNYNSKPTIIEFPYEKSQSIFHDGWLPQNKDENYRWVVKSASVELNFPPKANLVIEGFVPENFIEINKLNVYINNVMISGSDISPGEGFFLNIPINNTSNNNNIITLEFNSVHIPAEKESDQRQMSALISKIQAK
ncbi:acyltransferase family protein [Candidatus Pristimantibacillus sp. PTI5]|uniref:acyltransferase family protein n=1 Tax=Candidatus Pristimantibacillus sp. PTI5 TaxID=3400422 RepID=UPI003B0174A2